MGNRLYLECGAGISGDMFVASLLDLGANEERLREALSGIHAGSFEVRISRVKKSGLDACDFDVVLDKDHETHDHDMEYLCGHAHGHAHSPHQVPHQETHQGHHEHRGLPEIEKIIDDTAMTDRAKGISKRIFRILAEAESKAHGIPVEEVHFHEVGALDSIVDILSAAICLDDLDITEVVVTELTDGHGAIRCRHGILPVPVPAVANILSAYGIRLHIADVEGELVTPTGAAIAAAIRTEDRLPEKFVIKKIGLGAGKRTYPTSGILRTMLIE